MRRDKVKKGVRMRRGGCAVSEVGRIRREEVYVVEDVHGDFARSGYSRARLRLEGGTKAFWISDSTGWDMIS